MDRAALDHIEQKISDEVQERFPGAGVTRVALMQYGDEPEIEPGEPAVRWALARIRERPAYAQLRERAREIERLKTEF